MISSQMQAGQKMDLEKAPHRLRFRSRDRCGWRIVRPIFKISQPFL